MPLKGRKCIRLRKWDYSSEGIYYITICCRDKQSYFGKIENNRLILSSLGQIARQYWLEIPHHFHHVRLDDFVIMPDHIHGILVLDYSLLSKNWDYIIFRKDKTLNYNRFASPIRNSVSIIINQYKSAVKRWCNKNRINQFNWQSKFYDKIVFNESSLDEIRSYIKNNPIE